MVVYNYLNFAGRSQPDICARTMGAEQAPIKHGQSTISIAQHHLHTEEQLRPAALTVSVDLSFHPPCWDVNINIRDCSVPHIAYLHLNLFCFAPLFGYCHLNFVVTKYLSIYWSFILDETRWKQNAINKINMFYFPPNVNREYTVDLSSFPLIIRSLWMWHCSVHTPN